MNDLAIIVSSFNRAELLKESLASLLSVVPKLDRATAIIVFDAGSKDGSRELVENLRGKTRIPLHLIGPSEQGNTFAAGVNEAVRYALSNYPQTEFLLLFETDNYLDSVAPLHSAISLLETRKDLGATGYTVKKHSGSPAGFGCPFPKPFHFVLGPQLAHRLKLDHPDLEWHTESSVEWSECEVVYSSPILIRRVAWEKTDGLDAALFPFADCDLDWAWRLRAAGLRQAVIRTSQVVHDNHDQQSAWSSARVLHFHRARLRFLERCHNISPELLLPFLLLRHAVEAVIVGLRIFPAKSYALRLSKRWALLKGAFSGYG